MTGKLYNYIRVSDKARPVGIVDISNTIYRNVTRKMCFNNFIQSFGLENLKVFADNATDQTVEYVKSKGVTDIERTYLGNSSGFLYLIETAFRNLNDDDILYIVEDDYLHTPDARPYIFEGIEIGDYVSLFDSLDKYIDTQHGGYNPFIYNGGEDTKVILGRTIHFKYTNATTGTFAAKISTLKSDFDLILKNCQPDFPHMHDFAFFRELIEVRHKKLICPMPGKAGHVGREMPPFVDWQSIVDGLKE